MKHIFAVALLAVASVASAQNVQTKECSKGCTFATDPQPAGETRWASCDLVGATTTPINKPVVEGSTVGLPAGKTCYWTGVVITPGAYSVTAVVLDAAGNRSVPSLPLTLTVSAPPLGAPTNLRVQ
jgi:hypothetical protein